MAMQVCDLVDWLIVWRVYNNGVPQVMDCGGFWIFWVELEMEEELVIRVRVLLWVVVWLERTAFRWADLKSGRSGGVV